MLALALAVTVLTAGPAFAAGFQVSETSVSGLARAFAGAGIAADGPSDMFHNPAGLMLSEGREFEAGLHLLRPNAEYSESRSTITIAGMNTTALTGRESNGGEAAIVPNFYYAADLGEQRRYGLGIASPFGLTTEYDANWIGRYHAIKSELITLEVNPAVAWRLNEMISVGAGITLLKADAELSRAVPVVAGTDGRVVVEGDDTALGYNFGIIAGDENQRIGFGYRSKVDIDVDGDLTVTGTNPVTGAPIDSKTGASAAITLPATAYLSGFRKLTEKLDLLATLRWTDWSEFDELRIESDSGMSSVTPENWRDSNTYSIGLNYHHNDRWVFRAGYARDESPIKDDDYRTPRIPDSDRDWLTFGAGYRASGRTRVDFSFAHLFTKRAPVNETVVLGPDTNATLNGTYGNTETNIFALQAHIALGK